MELFAEALKMNGYLEYLEDNSYNITDTTRDAVTGLTLEEYKKKKLPLQNFHPATFIIITGGTDESGEDIPEVKQKIIRNVFNNIENVNDLQILLTLLNVFLLNESPKIIDLDIPIATIESETSELAVSA
jgi:hypothetical protein